MTNNQYEQIIKDFQAGTFNPLYETFGIPTDYTYDSLEIVEDVINTIWPPSYSIQFVATVIPFGFLLGETLVQNLAGSRWVTEGAEDFFDITVEIPSGEMIQKVRPFSRVDNFFNDRRDGIAIVYRMTEMMKLQLLDPKQLTDGEWLIMPNGDKIRVTNFTNSDK